MAKHETIQLKHALFDKVFNNDDGKDVIDILKKTCLYNQPSYLADQHYAQYIQGQRDLIRIIEMYMDEDITFDKMKNVESRTAIQN